MSGDTDFRDLLADVPPDAPEPPVRQGRRVKPLAAHDRDANNCFFCETSRNPKLAGCQNSWDGRLIVSSDPFNYGSVYPNAMKDDLNLQCDRDAFRHWRCKHDAKLPAWQEPNTPAELLRAIFANLTEWWSGIVSLDCNLPLRCENET